jgi:hypothetical protein
MSSIIRWRKVEILPAAGIEYAEGLLLLIASNGPENSNQRHVGGDTTSSRDRRAYDSQNVATEVTGRVSTLTHIENVTIKSNVSGEGRG